MQRTGFNAGKPSLAEPHEVIFGGQTLGLANVDFFLDQLAGDFHVAGNKYAEREFEIFDHTSMERLYLSRTVFRKLEAVLYLLRCKLHQILVDDIPDMFEIDRKRDDLHSTTSLAIVEAFPGYFRHIEFD